MLVRMDGEKLLKGTWKMLNDPIAINWVFFQGERILIYVPIFWGRGENN